MGTGSEPLGTGWKPPKTVSKPPETASEPPENHLDSVASCWVAMLDSVGGGFWVEKLFLSESVGTCGTGRTFGTDRMDRPTIRFNSDVFMVSLSGAFWRAFFVAVKPRRVLGNLGERSAGCRFGSSVSGREVRGLKPELRPEKALLCPVYRSLLILLPFRSCGGKGLGFLAC